MEGFEELTLELTDWCPSRCLHCSSNSGPNCNESLNRNAIFSSIEETVQLNGKKVSFSGGEPTGSQSFVEAVRFASKHKLQVEIFTCGIFKNKNELSCLPSEIIEACANLPKVKFIFSLYGAKSTTHEYVTQTPGSFKFLQKSIQSCIDAKIVCEINFVPLRINVNEFRALVHFVKELKLNRLSVLRFVPQGKGRYNQNLLELSAEQESRFIDLLLRLRNTKNVDIRTGSPFNGIIPGNKIPCRAGSGKLVIQPNGNVIPCEVYKHHNRCNWGLSIYRHTLSQILASPKLARLRKQVSGNNCFECPIHRNLRGDGNTKNKLIYEKVSTNSVYS